MIIARVERGVDGIFFWGAWIFRAVSLGADGVHWRGKCWRAENCGRRAILHLDVQDEFTDIRHMAKTAKQARSRTVGRSAKTGRFIGRTKEGLLIPRPDFKPESFTLSELEKAIRAAKRRQAATPAG